jgi:hypothetical protein
VIAGVGQNLEGVVVQVHRFTHLPKVVGTLHAARGLARELHRGQKQCNQDADDGDHHQQLHERKSGTFHETPPPENLGKNKKMKCGAHRVRTHTEMAASVERRRGVKQCFPEKSGLFQFAFPPCGLRQLDGQLL